MKYAILLILLVILSGCTPYRSTHNLPYGDGAQQTFDYYEPRVDVAGSPRPAILAIHGGGYVSGDKSWGEAVAERFCPWGYVVVSMNYSLAPDAHWPVQLDDAELMLEYMTTPRSGWMKIRQPVLGLGVSAGAHLVAALHLQGALVAGIGASGPWDMINESNAQLDGSLRALLGLEPTEEIPDSDRAHLSPVSWVTPAADLLLIHAKRDPLTNYAHATRMEETIQMLHGKVTLITIESDSHGNTWKDAVPEIRAWLRERQ